MELNDLTIILFSDLLIIRFDDYIIWWFIDLRFSDLRLAIWDFIIYWFSDLEILDLWFKNDEWKSEGVTELLSDGVIGTFAWQLAIGIMVINVGF